MDRTLLGQQHVPIKGGTLVVVSGKDKKAVHIGGEPVVVGRHPGCQLVLEDRKVSATHLDAVATEGGLRIRDLGSRNGTFIGDARIVEAFLTETTSLRVGDTLLEFRPGKPERIALPKEDRFGRLVGASAPMRLLFSRLMQVAPTTLAVLIQGETGTGKELVARAIHEASTRAHGPFEVIDCGAIPPNLIESVLFGHTKGAFTGATSAHAGAFVAANGGTVFLDELGELPVEMQPRLLRVLEEQKVKAVGASSYRPVDVRVVAATNRDLASDINAGRFRSDLFFRVACARIDLPPLRERTDDIPLLVRHMFEVAGKESAFRRVTDASLDALIRHRWPGNVRELANVVARAIACDRGSGPMDLAEHLGDVGGGAGNANGQSAPSAEQIYRNAREAFDRTYFATLWRETNGNQVKAAVVSGLDRATVRAYWRRLHIGEPRRPGGAHGAAGPRSPEGVGNGSRRRSAKRTKKR